MRIRQREERLKKEKENKKKKKRQNQKTGHKLKAHAHHPHQQQYHHPSASHPHHQGQSSQPPKAPPPQTEPGYHRKANPKRRFDGDVLSPVCYSAVDVIYYVYYVHLAATAHNPTCCVSAELHPELQGQTD